MCLYPDLNIILNNETIFMTTMQPSLQHQPEPTNEQRRIIYQARRGLNALDFYIYPHV